MHLDGAAETSVSLQKMSFLNCVTVTQNMCKDGFLHAILH